MLQDYASYIVKNNSKMPDPKKDAERFSNLHSWYKYLYNFTIAYPLLLKGEEPRYDFDRWFSDDNQENFHWRFVLEHNLNTYYFNENSRTIPEEILLFMK